VNTLGKRETEKKPKSPRDYYATIDPDAVKPLLPYVDIQTYIEPCAGAGDLIKLLSKTAICADAYDIDPQTDSIIQRNCLTLTENDCIGVDLIITNPPFTRDILLPMIDHLSSLRPTWLLLPADMMHNHYMKPHLEYCDLILSIGRLCWFKDKDGKMVKGVDNYCWYMFDQSEGYEPQETVFKGRI